MFSGLDFSYDGVLSTTYGIKILDFEGMGKFTTNILSSTVATSKPARSPRFYCVGSKDDAPPQFTLTVVSETALDGESRRSILSWLYNRNDFKTFKVYQPDLEGYYYKCIFTSADAIYINGKCHGFSFNGVLDSPYQYGEPTITVFDITSTSLNMPVQNNSDIPDNFVYPKITINKPATNDEGNIAIINYSLPSNSPRVMYLNYSSSAETLTVDCELKTINSNIRTYPMSNFSGQWTHLVNGRNNFTIFAPNDTTATIECPTYVLVGF